MNGKSFLGAVLVVVGLIAAGAGIVGGGRPEGPQDKPAIVGDQNQQERSGATSMALPVIAGLAIAGGAALVGIGMGHFRHPTIVPPESPHASEAATTRGPTP
jgi:hypothetical protein